MRMNDEALPAARPTADFRILSQGFLCDYPLFHKKNVLPGGRPRWFSRFPVTHLALVGGFILATLGCSSAPGAEPSAGTALFPGQTETSADWCAGHGVPESKCTLCHPELMAKFREAGDWCAEHQLPESVCPQCNPAPIDAAVDSGGDWCAGHGVPESKCTLCHPELIEEFREAGDWCAEHQLPESVCPQCNPQRVDLFPIEQRVIRFITPEKEAEAGIRTVPVRRGRHVSTISGPARIEFDADRVADLRTVVSGIVQKIHVSPGAVVERGRPLFELVSPQIGEVQAQWRTAKAKTRVAQINLQRQQSLAERNIASRWEVEQAEMELESAQAEVAAAETTLQTAGALSQDAPGHFSIFAPISGTLVHRTAILGALATDHTSLGMIADTSRMWVLCDLPERDAKGVRPGARLHFQSDDGIEANGRIAWIAAEVDPKTRTVSVRADVSNPNGDLRAHQFGRATIERQQNPGAWLVPAAAIQRVDQREVVFVRREPGVYVPREVARVGSGDHSGDPSGDWTSVEGRLTAGNQVVTTGAVLLRTEMLPGSIGAGCCEVEPLGASRNEP